MTGRGPEERKMGVDTVTRGTEKAVGTKKAEGDGRSVGVEKLVEAVRGGRADEVPSLLEGLGAADRGTVLAELKSLRTEVRGWEAKRPREAADVRRALYVAGAGCHPGASAAATWLGGRDLAPWRSEGSGLALRAVAGRSPEWLADVAGGSPRGRPWRSTVTS